MNKNLLLVCGAALICFGLLKPNLNNFVPSVNVPNNKVVVVKPSDQDTLDACAKVTNALKNGGSSRSQDGVRLASLYMDMAMLIELAGNEEIIKTTEEIRQANKLSGTMLQLELKDKYPDLSEAAESLVTTLIGNDNVALNEQTRKKASEAFKALAWACFEGSK